MTMRTLTVSALLLLLPACTVHRSMVVSPNGAVTCTRSQDVSKHLGGLANLVVPSITGVAPSPPAGAQPAAAQVLKSLENLPSLQSAGLEDLEDLAKALSINAEVEIARTEAAARIMEALAREAAVDACSEFLRD